MSRFVRECTILSLVALTSLQTMAVESADSQLVGDHANGTGIGVTSGTLQQVQLFTGSSAIFTGSNSLASKYQLLLDRATNDSQPQSITTVTNRTLANPMTPGGLCLLKNYGDRNCDGRIDNEDFALYSSDFGPLTDPHAIVGHSGSTTQGNFQFDASFGDYIYIATWANNGVSFSAKVNEPFGETIPQEILNWDTCTTGMVADLSDPDFGLTREQMLGELASCSFTPVTGNLSSGVLQVNPSGDQNVRILRRFNTVSKAALTLDTYDDGETITVTVDPADVAAFKLSLTYDRGQVEPIGTSGVAPYFLGDTSFVPETGTVNVAGSTDPSGNRFGPGQATFGAQSVENVIPLGVDLYRVQFRKLRPDSCRDACSFTAFADPAAGDFLQVFDERSDVPAVTELPPEQVASATVGFSTPGIAGTFPSAGGAISIEPTAREVEVSAVTFRSSNGGLSVDDMFAGPFIRVISNTPDQVAIATPLGQTATIDDRVTTQVFAVGGSMVSGEIAGESFPVTEQSGLRASVPFGGGPITVASLDGGLIEVDSLIFRSSIGGLTEPAPTEPTDPFDAGFGNAEEFEYASSGAVSLAAPTVLNLGTASANVTGVAVNSMTQDEFTFTVTERNPRLFAEFPDGGGPVFLEPWSGSIEVTALEFTSPEGHLIPPMIPDPSPFSFILSNTSTNISFAAGLGVTLTVDGRIALNFDVEDNGIIFGSAGLADGTVQFPISENVNLTSLAIPGDWDGDGQLGVSDFVVLSRNFGLQVANFQDGDLDGNGVVETTDFLMFSRDFRRLAPLTVPEPAGAMPFLLAGFCLASLRRRGRST